MQFLILFESLSDPVSFSLNFEASNGASRCSSNINSFWWTNYWECVAVNNQCSINAQFCFKFTFSCLLYRNSWKVFLWWCKEYGLRILEHKLKQPLSSESYYQLVGVEYWKCLWYSIDCFKYFFIFIFGLLCSPERCPPIDEVIKAGVVPRFVEFLGRHDLPQLQVGSFCTSNCFHLNW